MPTKHTCEECGAELPGNAPQGLCPRCLVSMGISLAAPAAANVESERRRQFGDYELLEEIARGGMGIVFKARQKKLDRIVAVKMILAGEFASREQALRFRAEVEAAARLQHPNIVRIHETGEQDGQPYFSMDHVEGGNLALLVREKPLPAKRAAGYVKTIAEAIHYAHEQGILHRDLKPSNVLIDSNDQPRVTDFGLAKRMQKESFLTVTGDVMGSPNFMPPEQAGARSVKAGRYSDVYSLGGILFYLVTGRPPFVAETVAETLQHVLNTEPVSPRLLNPSVPQEIATICLKSLEKEPAKRYETAQQLADELNHFLNSEPIQARPVSRIERLWRWGRRKPLVASLSAATSLLLLAIAIGSPIAAFKINRERQRAVAAERAQREQRQQAEAARLKAEAGETALLYWQAFNALPNLSETEAKRLAAENEPAIEDSAALAQRYDTTFKLLRQAANMNSSCDWAVNPADGPEMSVPSVSNLRRTAQAARFRARVALLRGHPETACQDLLAALVLARHVATEGALPIVMLQLEVESQIVEFVADNFPRFAPETLARLQQRIENAPPLRDVSHALEIEKKIYGDWLVGKVRAALAGAGGDEAKALVGVRELFGRHLDLDWDEKFPDEIIHAAGGTSAGVIAYTMEALPFYSIMQKIAVASPESVVSEGNRAIRLVAGNSNLIVRALMPNMYRARSHELETLARLAMLQAAVAYKQNGPAGLKTVRDPFGDGPFEMRSVDRGLELRSKLSQFELNGTLVFVEKDDSQ